MGSLARYMAFYNHGRKHFNKRGYKSGKLNMEKFNLKGKSFAVTGANSGIGKSLTDYLYSKNATVYMVCRSEGRAKEAKDEIAGKYEGKTEGELKLIIADVSLKSGVEKVIKDLSEQTDKLDCLVCNAGALLDKRTMTEDGVETTFACHLLFGTHLLGKLAMPLLEKSSNPKIIMVTSGGMYTQKLPTWDDLMKGGSGSFDGASAYSKAKRVQVVLAEDWAKKYTNIKIVTAHPGWTFTPGVDKSFGSIGQWFLSPLRTVWEGTEGIAWLAATEGSDLESGALYLDGEVQPKHLHSSTELKPEAVEALLKKIDEYNTGPVTDFVKE